MAIIWVGTGRFNAYIGPVQDYIDRVVAADVAAGNTLGLEVGVRDAYDVFIRDSINVGDLGTSGGVLSQANSIIKAAPIMSGARTLPGALVPLVGAAPTSFNFVAGDYNRKTGLKGDGSTKYLNSGRFGNSDPQNNKHMSVYATDPLGSTGSYIGGRTVPETIVDTLGLSTLNSMVVRLNSTGYQTVAISYLTGFYGLSRSNSIAINWRAASSLAGSISSTSGASPSFPIDVFRRSGPTNTDNTAARLAFYSIGESLDLALLDARVTALINAIAAAIP